MEVTRQTNSTSFPFLHKNIGQLIADCLVDVVHKRPEDPIDFIAKWLYHYADSRMYFQEKEKLEAALIKLQTEDRRDMQRRQDRVNAMKATILTCQAHMDMDDESIERYASARNASTFQFTFRESVLPDMNIDEMNQRRESAFATPGGSSRKLRSSRTSKVDSLKEERVTETRLSTIHHELEDGSSTNEGSVHHAHYHTSGTETENDADADRTEKKKAQQPRNWKGLKTTLIRGIRMTNAFQNHRQTSPRSQPGHQGTASSAPKTSQDSTFQDGPKDSTLISSASSSSLYSSSSESSESATSTRSNRSQRSQRSDRSKRSKRSEESQHGHERHRRSRRYSSSYTEGTSSRESKYSAMMGALHTKEVEYSDWSDYEEEEDNSKGTRTWFHGMKSKHHRHRSNDDLSIDDFDPEEFQGDPNDKEYKKKLRAWNRRKRELEKRRYRREASMKKRQKRRRNDEEGSKDYESIQGRRGDRAHRSSKTSGRESMDQSDTSHDYLERLMHKQEIDRQRQASLNYDQGRRMSSMGKAIGFITVVANKDAAHPPTLKRKHIYDRHEMHNEQDNLDEYTEGAEHDLDEDIEQSEQICDPNKEESAEIQLLKNEMPTKFTKQPRKSIGQEQTEKIALPSYGGYSSFLSDDSPLFSAHDSNASDDGSSPEPIRAATTGKEAEEHSNVISHVTEKRKSKSKSDMPVIMKTDVEYMQDDSDEYAASDDDEMIEQQRRIVSTAGYVKELVRSRTARISERSYSKKSVQQLESDITELDGSTQEISDQVPIPEPLPVSNSSSRRFRKTRSKKDVDERVVSEPEHSDSISDHDKDGDVTLERRREEKKKRIKKKKKVLPTVVKTRRGGTTTSEGEADSSDPSLLESESPSTSDGSHIHSPTPRSTLPDVSLGEESHDEGSPLTTTTSEARMLHRQKSRTGRKHKHREDDEPQKKHRSQKQNKDSPSEAREQESVLDTVGEYCEREPSEGNIMRGRGVSDGKLTPSNARLSPSNTDGSKRKRQALKSSRRSSTGTESARSTRPNSLSNSPKSSRKNSANIDQTADDTSAEEVSGVSDVDPLPSDEPTTHDFKAAGPKRLSFTRRDSRRPGSGGHTSTRGQVVKKKQLGTITQKSISRSSLASTSSQTSLDDQDYRIGKTVEQSHQGVKQKKGKHGGAAKKSVSDFDPGHLWYDDLEAEEIEDGIKDVPTSRKPKSRDGIKEVSAKDLPSSKKLKSQRQAQRARAKDIAEQKQSSVKSDTSVATEDSATTLLSASEDIARSTKLSENSRESCQLALGDDVGSKHSEQSYHKDSSTLESGVADDAADDADDGEGKPTAIRRPIKKREEYVNETELRATESKLKRRPRKKRDDNLDSADKSDEALSMRQDESMDDISAEDEERQEKRRRHVRKVRSDDLRFKDGDEGSRDRRLHRKKHDDEYDTNDRHRRNEKRYVEHGSDDNLSDDSDLMQPRKENQVSVGDVFGTGQSSPPSRMPGDAIESLRKGSVRKVHSSKGKDSIDKNMEQATGLKKRAKRTEDFLEIALWGLQGKRLVCIHPRLGTMGGLISTRKEASVEDWKESRYSCRSLFDQEIYTSCDIEESESKSVSRAHSSNKELSVQKKGRAVSGDSVRELSEKKGAKSRHSRSK